MFTEQTLKAVGRERSLVKAMKIRIKFKKYGVMKFIGHLDVMRYFQKAIRRAKIPVAYSGGFSPHQIMSFAAPLGVGLESNGEYMDISCHLEEGADTVAWMKDALNAVMAEGIEISSVRVLPDTVGNAMASVAAAKYSVRFREGYEPDFDWKSQMEVFGKLSTIPVKKKTKKSEKEFDLKSFLYELKVQDDSIIMTVDASSSGNIKPGLVMEAFYMNHHAGELSPYALLITREETYGRRDSDQALIALEEFGIEG